MVHDEKDDPYIAVLILIGLGLCAGLFLGWLFLSSRPLADVELRVGAGFCNGLLVLGGIGTLVSWLRWRQINRRRQAAASDVHSGALLAAVQPFPDEAALPLPAVIVHKRSRLRELALFVVLWLGVSGVITLMDAFLFRGVGWAGFFAEIRTNLLSFGGASAVGWLVSLLHSPYTQLEIYAGRLVLSAPTKKKTVRWDEARLFAVRGPRTAFSKATTYELASAKEVVTWKPLRRLHWWSIERPIVPFEEYQRQVEALLLLIAARTHLPLYDVRQPPVE